MRLIDWIVPPSVCPPLQRCLPLRILRDPGTEFRVEREREKARERESERERGERERAREGGGRQTAARQTQMRETAPTCVVVKAQGPSRTCNESKEEEEDCTNLPRSHAEPRSVDRDAGSIQFEYDPDELATKITTQLVHKSNSKTYV